MLCTYLAHHEPAHIMIIVITKAGQHSSCHRWQCTASPASRQEAASWVSATSAARIHQEQEGWLLQDHLGAVMLCAFPPGCISLCRSRPASHQLHQAVGTKHFSKEACNMQQWLGTLNQVPSTNRYVHRSKCTQHQKGRHVIQVAANA